MKLKNLGTAKTIEQLRNRLNEAIEEFGPDCEWFPIREYRAHKEKDSILVYDADGDKAAIFLEDEP